MSNDQVAPAPLSEAFVWKVATDGPATVSTERINLRKVNIGSLSQQACLDLSSLVKSLGL